ncbi:MAG: hypothetical protein DDT30_02026 [Dehalococcoidia bacterium]|nr:hypothetical protein [Bacillota bacterium]MBT9143743.1 hypothetical protein [Bacillota bacterium]
MKEKGDIQGLIRELKNNNLKVRIESTKALGDLQHIEGLIQALDNDNLEVRVQATERIKEFGDR